jgi:hypothetical protein
VPSCEQGFLGVLEWGVRTHVRKWEKKQGINTGREAKGVKMQKSTDRWRGRGERKVEGGGERESQNSADTWGGATVQHGRVTHGNKHVDGYGAVKSCIIVLCVEENNLLTCRAVYNVNVLIISGQLQILLIAFAGLWCVQFENGRRENVSARFAHFRCSR